MPVPPDLDVPPVNLHGSNFDDGFFAIGDDRGIRRIVTAALPCAGSLQIHASSDKVVLLEFDSVIPDTSHPSMPNHGCRRRS